MAEEDGLGYRVQKDEKSEFSKKKAYYYWCFLLGC